MKYFALRSDDPRDPRARLVVGENDVFGELFDLTEELATSDGPGAQTAEVYDRIVLTRERAAWLRDVLIAMHVDDACSLREEVAALARLRSNERAVTP